MERANIGNTGISISRVGVGGHYRAMEEGDYEDRLAYVEKEISHRVPLIAGAIQSGINYYDTTFRNEVAVLAAVLKELNARDQVVINGMVLGAFTGSKAAGRSVEDYFNRGLDERLETMPGHYFDTFMINAIEEGYNERECERLVKLLQSRQAAGDIRAFGISCHDPFLARQAADRFPEIATIMVPYNFHNRKFEAAFDGYTGVAGFIAMKALVWLEYGIPFCAINGLPDFTRRFGFAADEQASAHALRFIRANPRITSVICAVNSLDELPNLVRGGEGIFNAEDEALLEAYHQAVSAADSLALYMGALRYDNLRMNYFGARNLARLLDVPMPPIPLNEADSQARIQAFAEGLLPLAEERWQAVKIE